MHLKPSIFRAGITAIVVSLAAAFVPTTSAWAQQPAEQATTQAPGYYHMPLGEFQVTALFDGIFETDQALLKNIKPTELKTALSRAFVSTSKIPTAVNAYLINTGRHLILVDTGSGLLFGPTLGSVLTNLKAAGYKPEQIDTILLTHLHGDHIGGLNDAKGQAIFPNAKIWVSQVDHDYWLSPSIAAAAPAAAQPFFKMAREAAAAYVAKGQWASFADGDTLVPGVRALKAYGHTPGHSMFEVKSKGEKMLIWGDIVHSAATQFAKPSIAIEFDSDQKQAAVTRRAVLQKTAASATWVAGAHLPFPGIGHVSADGKAGYRWVPVEFSPLPSTTAQP